MQFLVPPVSEDRRRRWLLLSARRELTGVPTADRGHEPEEEMFRDAVRIGQLLSAGGTAPKNLEMVEEILSHFDQSSIIRLCAAKLKVLANGPLARFVEEVRVALDKREPQSLRKACEVLRDVSPSDPLVADLCAALMVASYCFEGVSRQRADLDEAA
jgi:hypothetical protein